MNDPKLTISSDDPCWEAYFDLTQGDLTATIFLLHEGTVIHPLLQRELARMMDGTHAKGSLVFKAKGKRGRPRAPHSPEVIQVTRGFGNGKPKTAKETAKALENSVSLRTVERAGPRIKAKQDKLLRFLVAHKDRQK